MGRLRFVPAGLAAMIVFLLLLSPACGGHKPAGASQFPAKINLNPGISVSLQVGATQAFTASAQNGSNTNIAPTFTYAITSPDSSGNVPSGVLDVSPSGFACAGSWNAPYYSVCTPGAIGVVGVVASALGATSEPTLVFVHAPIDNIQIEFVPPVNSPARACPSQTALPAACDIPFNTNVCQPNQPCACLSQNQTETLEAHAYSQGADITASVGPFSWSQDTANVMQITPIVSATSNVSTNQIAIAPNTPGQTHVVASSSGVSSQPYSTETCPVQCIDLQLGSNGSQDLGVTSFVTTKGTSETITATAVDVQGCIVPKPSLTWTSSAPAAITAGSGAAVCAAGSSCTITTPQPGGAAITASCSPPSCNVATPPIVPGQPTTLYTPQPVYPVTAISGIATGPTIAASVLASSQDCYSNPLCPVALWDISTVTNLATGATPIPQPPNSILFGPAGDKAYAGSQFGAVLITSANLGSATASPFTTLSAPATALGVVTGKVLAVSPNGALAVFSDTVSTPNQVYVVNTANPSASATPVNIDDATVATFAPDNSKVFILGDGGNTLYVYSPLQALQTYPLQAPASAIVFSSTGAFALLAGGSSTANITTRNTCDNSPAALSIGGLPGVPSFLKMIPSGNSSLSGLPATGADVFLGLDNTGTQNTGLDLFVTSAASGPLNTLCPQQTLTAPATFLLASQPVPNPLHIDLQHGHFHPIGFFPSPDATKVYIVTSDLGVLVYTFNTQTVDAIQLVGGAVPLAADMTVDGTLLYVAGSDGMLHEIVTSIGVDQTPILFFELPNSSNNFCYASYSCGLNLVAVKP
jgi:hypothetical protein